KYVEKWFCKLVDYITVPFEGAIKGYYDQFHHKIRVIPQGFTFPSINYKDLYVGNKVPTFLYAGSFYKNVRDPRSLLNYLEKIEIDFKFIIYTNSVKILIPY